jgi:hypothetical protein
MEQLDLLDLPRIDANELWLKNPRAALDSSHKVRIFISHFSQNPACVLRYNKPATTGWDELEKY